MRSESRTEETSGLVTTIASSAKYIAIWAPFSMPAGESQMMYSKPCCLELFDDAPDALRVQRVLVARLRRRQHVQVLDALVPDQRLAQLGLAVDDVDEVVNDAALAAHDQVEVAQTDVEVDRDRLVSLLREAGGDVGAGCGLADSAFA